MCQIVVSPLLLPLFLVINGHMSILANAILMNSDYQYCVQYFPQNNNNLYAILYFRLLLFGNTRCISNSGAKETVIIHLFP